MPTLIDAPTRVEAAGNKPKLIDEYIGRVNSAHEESASPICAARADGWSPARTPEFDEFTVVLRGTLRVEHGEGAMDVHAGQAVIAHTPANGYAIAHPVPDGAEYIAVCLPAFSPATVHRDV